MKKRTKVLAVILAVILLMIATVFGTMAYLTDTQSVKNTFTVGKVKIKLDQADVKADGTYVTDKTSRVTDGNEYKLMPGHTYIKDPTVTVLKNSESSYIRVLVTFNKADELKEVFGNPFLPEVLVGGWDKAAWVSTGVITEGTREVADPENTDQTITEKTLTYEFRYYTTVDTLDGNDKVLDELFEYFTIPGTVTDTQLAKLEGLDITIVAHAIQADGFADADAAWAAWTD
ncbi:MAG: hypothetical protein HUJ69_02980 [Lachnospiraceae bacterium]|nr:hypothetical protein [Lachnospiraceae bacterium]